MTRNNKPNLYDDEGRRIPGWTCGCCRVKKPLTEFDGLPNDHRCRDCTKTEQFSLIRQKTLAEAERKLAQVMDAFERQVDVPEVDLMLRGVYKSWGGYNTFTADLVANIKHLAATNKVGQAVQAQLNILKLHARSDQNRRESDFDGMSEAELREALKVRTLGILAEIAEDEEKMKALAIIMGKDPEAFKTPDKPIEGEFKVSNPDEEDGEAGGTLAVT